MSHADGTGMPDHFALMYWPVTARADVMLTDVAWAAPAPVAAIRVTNPSPHP